MKDTELQHQEYKFLQWKEYVNDKHLLQTRSLLYISRHPYSFLAFQDQKMLRGWGKENNNNLVSLVHNEKYSSERLWI